MVTYVATEFFLFVETLVKGVVVGIGDYSRNYEKPNGNAALAGSRLSLHCRCVKPVERD